MSGLAKFFQGRIDAEYVAGLWSHALLDELSWQGLRGRAPFQEYTGPSWSWAAYDGIAATDHREWTPVAVVQGWWAEPKDKCNPFGEVRPGAWVNIRGPVTKLQLSPRDDSEDDIRLRRTGVAPLPRFCTAYSEDDIGSRMRPDHAECRTSQDLQTWDLQVMILGGREFVDSERNSKDGDGARDEHGDRRPLDSFYGLVVRRTKLEQLERLGWMSLDETEAYSILEDKENWKTITLF